MPKGNLLKYQELEEQLLKVVPKGRNNGITTSDIKKALEKEGVSPHWHTIKNYLDNMKEIKKAEFGSSSYKTTIWYR